MGDIMHEIDLSNFDLRTDLIIEKNIQNIHNKKDYYGDITVDDIMLKKNNVLKKKAGEYITISFKDITDSNNFNKVLKVFKKE